ncbi:MAG: bifunctional 2-polyprenyl-6-hydroxyphenol methylase/3-demethylubiquinol 3-O-methyltransferase UbiG [Alphaproteobacteria bacterium]
MNTSTENNTSIDQEEIKHFTKDASQWWNPDGPFKPLHKLNPVRLSFITEQITTYFKRKSDTKDALEGLDILDIGCGGGLICEPLAKLKANITGLDADPTAIDTATRHARQSQLDITYLNEDLKNIQQQYDVVLALEVIEHVTDISLFIKQCANALKPEGILIISTINRTAKSFALGIIAAEYILRWVPKGTHSWHKFVKPSEIIRAARTHNIQPIKISGMVYNPLADEFTLSDNSDINYTMSLGNQPKA